MSHTLHIECGFSKCRQYISQWEEIIFEKVFLFLKTSVFFTKNSCQLRFTKVKTDEISQENTGAMYKNKNSLSEIISPHYASPP